MQFPTITGMFLSDMSAVNIKDCLIYILQHDLTFNTKIIYESSNEIVCKIYPVYFLARNAFLPNVHVVVRTENSNSICVFEYSLKKGTRFFLTIYIVISLMLEFLLLFLVKQLASPLLLLIPMGLIIFAAMMAIGSLYVFSMQIQQLFLHLFIMPSKPLFKIVL